MHKLCRKTTWIYLNFSTYERALCISNDCDVTPPNRHRRSGTNKRRILQAISYDRTIDKVSRCLFLKFKIHAISGWKGRLKLTKRICKVEYCPQWRGNKETRSRETTGLDPLVNDNDCALIWHSRLFECHPPTLGNDSSHDRPNRVYATIFPLYKPWTVKQTY